MSARHLTCWLSLAVTMATLQEKPDASEEEMRETIAAHYNPEAGAGGDPAAVRAAAEHAASGGKACLVLSQPMSVCGMERSNSAGDCASMHMW